MLDRGTYTSSTNFPYLKCYDEMDKIQDGKETLDYIYLAFDILTTAIYLLSRLNCMARIENLIAMRVAASW
jgi:hypothetical protein